MELKYLHINEKQYNEELLISHEEVNMLKTFLSGLIHNEILVINTNLGLEIYYEANNDCTKIIKDTLAIVVCNKHNANDDYSFCSFQSENEIQQFMDHSIEKIVEMPLFLNYTKSMLLQLRLQFESNKKLIGRLSDIWHEVTRNLQIKNSSTQKIKAFQNNFQSIQINNVENDILKNLIAQVLEDRKRLN